MSVHKSKLVAVIAAVAGAIAGFSSVSAHAGPRLDAIMQA